MWFWWWVPVGYLLGSLSSAVIVCKLWGLPDPRTAGSHNPGATNVLRIGNKQAAVVTLLGDVLKGFLPVALARWFGADPAIVAATGLAAFCGHLYPVFFGFQGGKGVATALGALSGIHLGLGLALAGTWLTMAKLTRISSLSALTAAVLAPIYAHWLVRLPSVTVSVTIMAGWLIFRHRDNIRRLLRGEEGRIEV
ncbi:MAG: glycerol-3-phosphate 1-O-acyltransferase PlsY [Methylohalobius sp.]|nr:glycerol-3-phosphate 1-O-acyltransferase PlsY [Methylohalobius sp.]